MSLWGHIQTIAMILCKEGTAGLGLHFLILGILPFPAPHSAGKNRVQCDVMGVCMVWPRFTGTVYHKKVPAGYPLA